MGRASLDDLAAFAVVARLRSFRKAAAELGTSTSNLSHTIRRLETRLGVRLLQRNSRSVSVSEVGETVLGTLEPALQGIEGTLETLNRGRQSVSGTLRITATRQAYEAVIRPMLPAFVDEHPHAAVEFLVEYAFRDIVADGFDAGVRFGEKVERDMIALKVGPELRMAVVASPGYLARHGTPQHPRDLVRHRCIHYRMASAGSLLPWRFRSGAEEFEVRVAGPLTFNDPSLTLDCSLKGLGIGYMLEPDAATEIARGSLVRLFEEWTPSFPGFFLYYPSRQQMRPVFAAFLEMLRRSAAHQHPNAAHAPVEVPRSMR
jgi:DNA-binding transcriptional LysR family regulator